MTRPYVHASGRVHVITDDELRGYFQATARKIRDARIDFGASQEELALASGIGEAALCRIEQGRNNHGRTWTVGPRVGTLIRLARALDLLPSELLP